jgi:hypothetical protein
MKKMIRLDEAEAHAAKTKKYFRKRKINRQ